MLLGISKDREFWGRDDGKHIQVHFDVSQVQENADIDIKFEVYCFDSYEGEKLPFRISITHVN